MRTKQLTTDRRQQDERPYALRRGLGFWELTFEGRQAVFKHELGAPRVRGSNFEARRPAAAGYLSRFLCVGCALASLKGIVWVGVGLFVFGLASLVWPPLKGVVGSVTTSAALMLGGLALMGLPSLMVGNELLILGGVALGVGGWFLAHRHGQLRGLVAASTGDSVKRER